MSITGRKLLGQYNLPPRSVVFPPLSVCLSDPLTLCSKTAGRGTHVHANWKCMHGNTHTHTHTHTIAQADLPPFCRLRLVHLDSHSMLGAFLTQTQHANIQCVHSDTHTFSTEIKTFVVQCPRKHMNSSSEFLRIFKSNSRLFSDKLSQYKF